MNFVEFFKQATGNPPYDYQQRLAEADPWPDLLEAPTGAGKTEAIVLAWLWRRRYGPANVRVATPRRLAYTLPMRVLVEQTRDRIKSNDKDKPGFFDRLGEDFVNIPVEILMGGETDNDWDLYPEREAVLIGTQDMLLSRALNRGYALGRARWPMPYGLLNNDCLWVFDEVQLMGSGLATTAQLAAFREKFQTWGNCPSLWVSATLRSDWLATVDFRERVEGLATHGLMKSEWRDTDSELAKRLKAKKILSKAKFTADDPKKLAVEIHEAHQQGQLTLVVLNTVKKAVTVYAALKALLQPAPKKGKKAAAEQTPLAPAPDVMLLHSRFRPPDREAKMRQLKQFGETGGIVISTQVVEAGVDMSARVLFTELSPWASFVQRVGRCNRKGEFTKGAEVFWIDVDSKKAAPYTPEEVDAARVELKKMEDVGPRVLRDYLEGLSEPKRKKLYPYTPGSVIRKRTVEELFDTTADLTDADLDVSPYIREDAGRDVQVFWRKWTGDNPDTPEPQPLPARDELCTAPLADVRDLLKLKKKAITLYRWDFLESIWQRTDSVVAGQVYLLPAEDGRYSTELGWAIDATDPVEPVTMQKVLSEGNDSDPYSQERKIWQTIAGHTNQVVEELENILNELDELLTDKERAELRHAARWHDWGKAYYVFQDALTAKAVDVPELLQGHLWGKSNQKSERYKHPGFRHELASALGMLSLGHSDLSCYIVATHHGKVRLSIRSLPTETPAPDGKRFARGVWEGDSLPVVKLGGGVVAPEVTLSLAPMELGLNNGQPSWAERVLQLLEDYGPFRLAYLEALLCAADRRASANARPGGDE
jgi:CRISPR-associated endonuclease/helicase Cas3